MPLGFVVVAGLMLASAQQTQIPPALNSEVVPIADRCPGGLHVQHQPTGGGTMWTVAQEDKGREERVRDVRGPGVHVAFNTFANVQKLELTVSYLPAGLRVTPIEPGIHAKSAKELKKTFVLQPEPARQVDADLLVGPAATIKRVHLVNVTFSNGTFWRASSEEECSVPPALYMPVEAKK